MITSSPGPSPSFFPRVGLALLAAGKGTRLKMPMPKVLAPLLGLRVIDYPLRSFMECFGPQAPLGLIVGHGKEEVMSYVSKAYTHHPLHFVEQKEQLGTGHALQVFFEQRSLFHEMDYMVVMCGDAPLIHSSYLKILWNHLLENPSLEGVLATGHLENPFGFGRIIRAKAPERGVKIVEERHLKEEEKRITEINSSLYIFKTSFMLKFLKDLPSHSTTKEIYLTDLLQHGRAISALTFDLAQDFVGINTPEQYAQVTKSLRKKKIKDLMNQGVMFEDPDHAYVDWDVQVKPGAFVGGQVRLLGTSVVDEGAILETGSIVKNTMVGHGAEVKAYSYVEEAVIGAHSVVGPFARLRPQTQLGEHTKVGNFVEIKKARLEEGVKVSHLSYVGDAFIGANTNIGCGFITCNYDGVSKHQTVIGENSFIGSDCQMVAPVTLGKNTYVASGSTINQNMPDGAFAIARSRQLTKPDMAKRFLKQEKT